MREQRHRSRTFESPWASWAVMVVAALVVAVVSASCVLPPPPVSNRSPVAVVSVLGPSTGRAPLMVTFAASGSFDPDGSVVSYRWDWGDGTASGTTSGASHVFSSPGTYVVRLTVTDNAGGTGTSTTTVVVTANLSPTAAAATTTPTVVAPATVAFSSAGSVDPDGTIVSYSWDFGDGSPPSDSANPTKVFTTPGSYLVTLTVADDNGAHDTASVNVVVLAANQVPVAVANATPDRANRKAPLAVVFSSAGSVDPDGTIVSYHWDFNSDGTVDSTSADPTYTYATPGTYTAGLTVTDDDGATGAATVVVTVSAVNLAPTAAAWATPTTGKVPVPVQFSSAGSGDTDGTIVAYAWNFGDGNTSTLADPEHTYTLPGVYTATVTVTDDDGATATASVGVQRVLNVFPTASASAIPSTGKGPLAVQLSSAGAVDIDGTLAAYAWDFDGNGTVDSTAANPTNVFAPSASPYTVTLTVTDDDGDSDSATVQVVSALNAAPVAVANSDVSSGDAPLTVVFSSTGSTDPDASLVSSSWSFGDGSPASTDPNPTHTYTAAGSYTAVLTVTDTDGATATSSLTITVSPVTTTSTSSTSTTPTTTSTTTTTVPDPPYPSGLTEHTMQVGTESRSFLIHVPEDLMEPRGVVIVLHGGGGAGNSVAESGSHPLSVFRTVADREGFVAVYPAGLPSNDVEGNPAWVDCRADNTVASGADDVAFLSDLVTRLAEEYGLPPSRVFMAGSSNGSQMSQAFAFRRPELIGGIAGAIGSLPLNPRPGRCTQGPDRPVPVLLVHGTDDPQVPYAGGCVADLGGSCNRGRVIGATETRDRWLQINGLAGVVPTETVVNLTPFDAGDAHRFEYLGPTPVEWWRLDGAGHSPPSRSVFVATSSLLGTQNRDIEFAEVAWSFFERTLPPE